MIQFALFLHDVLLDVKRRYIMKVSNVDVKNAPTENQMKMLEAAAKRPICFDEDCPELSDDDLAKFKKISDARKVSVANKL